MKKVIRTLLLSMAFMAIPSISLVCCSNNDEPEIEPTLAEEYSGTMMGDMTFGSVTISNLVYDENKGGFYRNYGGEGITQTMNDKAYPLNAPSSIIVTKDKWKYL